MTYDYKPSPFYRSPFVVGLAVILAAILMTFSWVEWGPDPDRPKSTSSNPPTPVPTQQNGGTQP